jgi:hypothetical protein
MLVGQSEKGHEVKHNIVVEVNSGVSLQDKLLIQKFLVLPVRGYEQHL